VQNESSLREIRQFDFVDALRGWAFLGVLLLHVSQKIPYLGYSLSWGQYGVQLFFVMSAFTLCFSFHVRSNIDGPSVSAFLIRRFFRIAPMFWLAILFYTLWRSFVILYLAPRETDGWRIFLTAIFAHGWSRDSINNIVPGGWTIAVEMNFYLLLPFLAKYLSNLKRAAAATVLLLGFRLAVNHFYAGFFSAESDLDRRFLYFWLPNQLPVFAFGIILFHGVRAQLETVIVPAPAAKKRKRYLAPCLLVLFLILFTMGTAGRTFFAPHLFFGAAFLVLGACLALRPYSFFVNRLTCHTGKVSYSAYLWHFFVISWIVRICLNLGTKYKLPYWADLYLVLIFVVAFVLTVGLSSLTYAFVEKPFQDLGKRIIRRRVCRGTLESDAKQPARDK